MTDAVSTLAEAPAVKAPGIHLLPLNLGRLSVHADTKARAPRFSLDSVSVRFSEDGTYTADATDTKHLVRVSGPVVTTGEDYPTDLVPALAHAPNGEFSALVSAGGWAKAFAGANKLKLSKRKGGHESLKSVACVTGKDVTTFAASDGVASLCESSANVVGRFPPVTDIIEKTRKECSHTFSVDAIMLAEILKTAAGFSAGDCNRVTFHINTSAEGKNKALLVTARNEKGQEFTALQMSLTGE